VFNEKPTAEEMLALDGADAAATALPGGVVIHTTRGDITIKLFPSDCPKTVENFTTHARNKYYDNLIVHRVIKVRAVVCCSYHPD
jgi:peptidylprolyl isomerase domain and WD repeat-containing protein 1